MQSEVNRAMEKYAARASVHTVVEYALMGGDLLPAASAERLLEGVRGHRSLQSMEQEGVVNELPVRCTAESEHVSLTVYGRIDRLHGLSAVEEIKTILCDAPEDADPLHWAQAECYAHMVCQQEDVPFDMECYKDADGNVYDFAFGLNWKGQIRDARYRKYCRK